MGPVRYTIEGNVNRRHNDQCHSVRTLDLRVLQARQADETFFRPLGFSNGCRLLVGKEEIGLDRSRSIFNGC